jgi:hypothetical protein
LSWKRDGSLLVTTAKDKTMQIIDPRNKNTSENLVIYKIKYSLKFNFIFIYNIKKFENAKTSNKDSKVVWIGTTNCILSSIYTQVLLL